MNTDSLLAKWTVPNDDGTYDVYDGIGNLAYQGVSRSFALTIARRLDRGQR